MKTAIENYDLTTRIQDDVAQIDLHIAEFRSEVSEFRTGIELLRADIDRRFDRLASLSDAREEPPRPAPAAPSRDSLKWLHLLRA